MTRTPKALHKMKRILEAGSALFSRQGYERTTLEDIARKARMGKATLYYYYPGGKEAIFSSVLQHEVDSLFQLMLERMGARPSAEERLRAYVEARVELYQEQFVLRGTTDRVFQELVPLAETELRRYYEKEIEVLESLVQSAIREGSFRQVEPRLAARVLQAGMKSLTIDNPNKVPDAEREHEINSFLSLLIEGLRNRDQ